MAADDQNDLPPDFDPDLYLRINPDVAAQGLDPREHYLGYGRHENRAYRAASTGLAGLPADFDPELYLQLNPDVAAQNLDPREHYAAHGARENRSYTLDAADLDALPPDFDPDLYLRLNPDVADESLAPALHYRLYGKKEGRLYRHRYSTAHVDLGSTRHRPYPSPSAASTSSLARRTPIDPKVVAFYLPQYHRVEENERWWGEGFTEWTNVRKAVPNYVGHRQPRVPLNQNYYDLSSIEPQVAQAYMAQAYGVSAFCYYMYWFNGRRLLETPLDLRLQDKSITMEFCMCWANESWTRTWSGRPTDVLLEQVHSLESDRRFIRDAIRYLSDPRYMRIDGKLLLLVYRVDLIPNCAQIAEIWRDEVRKAGLGEILLCAVQYYAIDDPTSWGFDAAVEFPPHGWLRRANLPTEPPTVINPDFSGQIFDYAKAVDFALRKETPPYRWYRGAFPGWDNTPRRQNAAHIFAHSSPAEFERWLVGILRQQILTSEPAHQLIFVNAWNEWGEGAHLEPDEELGHRNLEALRNALQIVTHESEPLNILRRLRSMEPYETRGDDETVLLNLLRGYDQTIRHLMSHPRSGS